MADDGKPRFSKRAGRGGASTHARGPTPQPAAEPVSPPPSAEPPWVLLRSMSGSPLIYRKMIRGASADARPGAVTQVYDKAGYLVGRGLYNPRSQVALRMLSQGAEAIDDAFWRDRLSRALSLRWRLNLDAVTDAYRLVHAEGDGLSGLVIERYADTLVFEVFALGMFHLAPRIAEALRGLLPAPSVERSGGGWRMTLRAMSRVEQLEGFRVTEETAAERGFAFERDAPGRLVIREHGVRYRVDVAGGHKTGFFCDQRDNRRGLAGLCRDASVLDACCYTGGFGLCAKILGGAREVISVDLDEDALALARENANLNQARVQYVHSDAFIYLRQMLTNGRQFDVVVLDPPKFAPTRDDLELATAKYHDLNKLAIQVTRPGGLLLTCSCSGLVSLDRFMSIVQAAARSAGRSLQLFDQTGAAPDHPVMLNCPESAYLKALWLRVL